MSIVEEFLFQSDGFGDVVRDLELEPNESCAEKDGRGFCGNENFLPRFNLSTYEHRYTGERSYRSRIKHRISPVRGVRIIPQKLAFGKSR